MYKGDLAIVVIILIIALYKFGMAWLSYKAKKIK